MSIHYAGDIDSKGNAHPFRVAVRDGVSPDVTRHLENSPGIEVVDDPAIAQAALIRSATKFMSPDAIQEWAQLMFLVRVGVGTDNIKMDLASEAGIATMNTPGASTEAVAIRAVTFMLAWAARLKQGTDSLAKGTWPKGDQTVEPRELDERTLGIVGYGRIGRATAKKAAPFFGKTIFTDTQSIEGMTSMQELLASADVISVHASGDTEVLTPTLLQQVRSGSLIVNTSRGGVINPAALLDCMDRGVSVALDVFPTEGPAMFQNDTIQKITQHPLFFGTPHTAASGSGTQKKLGLEGAGYATAFAHHGSVNTGNIPGHTLPRMIPTERKGTGVRGVVTHPSVKGTIGRIGNIAQGLGLNIAQFCNEQGPKFGETRLAITAFDLEDAGVEEGLNVMRAIGKEISVLRSRLLLYENGTE